MSENSFPSFGTELGAAWDLYKAKIAAFVLIALVGFGAMIMVGKGWLWLSFKIIPQNPTFVFLMPILGLLASLLPLIWMWAAFLFTVSQPDRGVGEACVLAFTRFLGMLLLWFLLSLSLSGGLTLLILPGLVLCVWFFSSWYVLIGEGLGAIDALVQSREYVRGRFFLVAGRLLAVVVINFIISAIIVSVLMLVGLRLVAAFVGCFAGLFLIVYGYILYQSLRARPDVVRADALSGGDKLKTLWLGLVGALVAVAINAYSVPKKISAMKEPVPGTEISFMDMWKGAQGGKEGEKAMEAMAGNLQEATLRQMASQGNTEFVKNMLETEGVNIETKNEHGLTPLLLASWKGHADTVEFLLAQGADIEAKNKDGLTALMYTAENGHTEILQTLLAKGASTEAKNREGTTALIYAAGNDHVRSIHALLATVETKVETLGMTVSFRRADIDAKNNHGNTALMYAVSEGHADSVQALLAHGANTEIKDNDGDTALTMAERRGMSNIVQMLK